MQTLDADIRNLAAAAAPLGALMPLDESLVFGLDYPVVGRPLYSNVNFVSGYCFHPAAVVQRIALYLNGKYQDQALGGHPRLDVSRQYVAEGDRSFLSGFQCFFDATAITRGDNRFDFEIDLDGRTVRVVRTFHQTESGALAIADVFIDIVGPCNLRCAMCPQGPLEGSRGERGRGFISVEVFDRVLAHLRRAGYGVGRPINLYNWGDPLLHPQLDRILEACSGYNYRAVVSTNLSFPWARVHALTRQPVDLLLVSMSGFSEPTYRRNHIGGNFELVLGNLKRLRENRGAVRAIVLKYLVFRYNQQEIEAARAFANEAGFAFGAYQGAIPSPESFFRYQSDPDYRRATDAYIAPETLVLRPARFCPQETTLTINHRAELDRCCVSWGSDARVSVFDADLTRHLKQKTAGEFCQRCLASGYAHYKHFGVMRPELLRANPNDPSV
jgi:MoaA/NifB/PqqE/SkfB family radical SAM enzyme